MTLFHFNIENCSQCFSDAETFLHQQVKTVFAELCYMPVWLVSHQVSCDELLLLCGQAVVQWHLTPADAQQREENAQVNDRADAVHGAECASQSWGFKVQKNSLILSASAKPALKVFLGSCALAAACYSFRLLGNLLYLYDVPATWCIHATTSPHTFFFFFWKRSCESVWMKHDITLIMTYDPFWAPQRTFQFLKVQFFFLLIYIFQ